MIKSPLPFKFGVNLKGNFDDWSYQLCKAKYKSTKLPVYTSRINDIQINLASSIKDIFRRGVDIALRETSSAALSLRTDSVNADNALTAEEGDDMLSGEELVRMDEYLAETELEKQGEEIEAEIDAMFDDMFTPEALESLTQDSRQQREAAKAEKKAQREKAAADRHDAHRQALREKFRSRSEQ